MAESQEPCDLELNEPKLIPSEDSSVEQQTSGAYSGDSGNKDLDFKVPLLPSSTNSKSSNFKSAETPNDNDSLKNEGTDDVKRINSAPSNNNTSTKSKIKSAAKTPLPEIPLEYKQPEWGGIPEDMYHLEVLKNGQIIDKVDLSAKGFHLVGRLESCDLKMEHPTLSRHHAVLQYCVEENERHNKGWYLYDLDSTHGTFVNKEKLKPRVFRRLRVGHCVKFAGSTRILILQGPAADADEESSLTVTEMKEIRHKEKIAEIIRATAIKEAIEDDKKQMEEGGVSWGMAEDAIEVTHENPFRLESENSAGLDLKDPRKTLKGFFENEGNDPPQYEVEEEGHGKHRVRVDLPLKSANGENIFVEINHDGKKKDAITNCALEACKVIDKMGLLRRSNHESRQRKSKDWSKTDFYDSDDDEYNDRTGAIEKKRKLRMRMAGKVDKKVETFDGLQEQLQATVDELTDITQRLDKAKADFEATTAGVDALDAYMIAIKAGCMDTRTRTKLRARAVVLKQERQRLERLLKIATPALPSQTSTQPAADALKKPVLRPRGPAVPKPPEKEKKPAEAPDAAPNDETPVKQPVSAAEKREGSTDALQQLTADNGVLTTDVTSCATSQTQDGKSDAHAHSNPVTADDVIDLEADNDERNEEAEETKEPAKKKKRTRKKEDSEVIEPPLSKKYCENDPSYATWMPPKDQSGDGKTSLNAKFGY